MTDTELKTIAPPANIGLSNNPHTGYSTPAAIGIPIIFIYYPWKDSMSAI